MTDDVESANIDEGTMETILYITQRLYVLATTGNEMTKSDNTINSDSHTPVTMLTSGSCCVSFLGGMNRFKFGDTMVTDWVYLRGHRGSGESSNFF